MMRWAFDLKYSGKRSSYGDRISFSKWDKVAEGTKAIVRVEITSIGAIRTNIVKTYTNTSAETTTIGVTITNTELVWTELIVASLNMEVTNLIRFEWTMCLHGVGTTKAFHFKERNYTSNLNLLSWDDIKGWGINHHIKKLKSRPKEDYRTASETSMSLAYVNNRCEWEDQMPYYSGKGKNEK